MTTTELDILIHQQAELEVAFHKFREMKLDNPGLANTLRTVANDLAAISNSLKQRIELAVIVEAA